MNVQLANATGVNGWGESAPAYHNLYGGLPVNVANWIEQDILQISQVTGKKQITLIDYGCGTGRYFPLYLDIAKKHGLNVKCLAFEPTLGQLEISEKHLKEWGFKIKDTSFEKSLEKRKGELEGKHAAAGFRGPEYKKSGHGKGSLTVELIHGNIFPEQGATYNPEYLENELFGKDHIDYGLCLFGVLSYIMGDANRVAMLKTFTDIVNGPVRVSIPTQNRDRALYQEFEGLRSDLEKARHSGDTARIRELESKLKDVQEHGETITPFPAKNGETTFHPYYYTKNHEEFEGLLQRAGIKDYEMCASNIDPETFITDKDWPFRNIADALNSATLKPKEMNHRAKFLMVKMQGQKALDAGFSPVTAVDPKTIPYKVIQGPYQRETLNAGKPPTITA